MTERALPRDCIGAIRLAETAVSTRIFVTFASLTDGGRAANVFGEPLLVERIDDVPTAVCRAREALEAGERACVIATARGLAGARAELREIAEKRLAGVIHVAPDPVLACGADAFALANLGWGLLFPSGVEDSLDLALVARRAAEDSGTPFLVVHDHACLGEGGPLECITSPTRELCEAFVGSAKARLRRMEDAAHPIHAAVTDRVFAERAPFALGSALRELESLTGRRHDLLERAPAADAAVVLVGLGELGDALIGAAERMRAQGLDVGAVKITALRPFPGPRLVKMLARALAVSVLEAADEPLAQSNALTREIKSAFADALTWAPGYPGVGRIPRVYSGVAAGLEEADIDAVVGNMLADERGKRTFVLKKKSARGGAPCPEDLPVAALERRVSPLLFSMVGRVADTSTAVACGQICAGVLSGALGLKARVVIHAAPPSEGGGIVFELVASRERPRGTHARHAVRLVAIDDSAALIHGNALLRLAEGGVVAVGSAHTSGDRLWGDLPPYAKAIVVDRSARVIGWGRSPAAADPDEARWLVAAGFCGIALASASRAGRSGLDGALVAREVAEVTEGLALGASLTARVSEHARRVFEANIEVSRATVERDEEAIRLGRSDARAGDASEAKGA